ncbi:MAG: hypothetical protein QXT28_07085 [Thermofilaceae archaeon]
MISLKRMIFFMLCLNLGCWMVAAMFPEHAPISADIPISYEQAVSTLQELKGRDPLSMVALMAGYVWAMFVLLLDVFSWAIGGMPMFLAAAGAPAVITIPVATLWAVCFLLGVIELLSGRNL